MSKGQQYVAELLGGRFDIHTTAGTDTGLPLAFDLGDAIELDARKAELDRMRARFAEDPQKVLDQFRGFFHDPELTVDDLQQYIATWDFALTQPDAFADAIESGQTSFGLGDWFDRVRGYLHAPKDVSAGDAKLIAELRDKYRVPADIAINPNFRQFETYDPGWVPLLNAKVAEERGSWPDLQPFRHHDAAASKFIYPSDLAYGAAGIKIGLLSDFGTGYYHSQAIARQLEAWAYPYLFHLGDVYYAGRPDEFASRFKAPLANVVKRTKLLGLAENHELYTGGKSYLQYFDELRHAGLTPQEGSYFCVPFQHHQVIGIDVNWNGRQSFIDPKCRDWLRDVIAGSAGRTNLLLTGSAPFGYPSKDRNPLLADLWQFVRDGKIQFWAWGDDHYCAVFGRHPQLAPFIGACIGHGGFPGERQAADRPCWTPPLWVEDEPRFPAWTKLHQDAGNNGWCEATLTPDGGLDLLFVDWLAAKRHRIRLTRNGDALQAAAVETFGGRGDRAAAPVLHRPA